MCDNAREDEDCELVFVQDDAERDEDYYDEYEDNRYEDYGEVNSDRGRQEKTNTEMSDANSGYRRVEEQISSNEQEDAEEREQSRYTDSEGHSANANCVVDDELDVYHYNDQRARFGAILVFQQ